MDTYNFPYKYFGSVYTPTEEPAGPIKILIRLAGSSKITTEDFQLKGCCNMN